MDRTGPAHNFKLRRFLCMKNLELRCPDAKRESVGSFMHSALIAEGNQIRIGNSNLNSEATENQLKQDEIYSKNSWTILTTCDEHRCV